MITIQQSSFYESNRQQKRNRKGEYCVICGRVVSNSTMKSGRVWNGSQFVTEEEAEKLNPAGDTGYYLIGNDCLRKNPQYKPYVQ